LGKGEEGDEQRNDDEEEETRRMISEATAERRKRMRKEWRYGDGDGDEEAERFWEGEAGHTHTPNVPNPLHTLNPPIFLPRLKKIYIYTRFRAFFLVGFLILSFHEHAGYTYMHSFDWSSQG